LLYPSRPEKEGGEEMIMVKFSVKLDKDGKIEAVYRTCNASRPFCKGCIFEEKCDKIMEAIKEVDK